MMIRLILLMSVILSGCDGAKTEEYRDYDLIDLAFEKHKEKSFQESISLLDSAININPKNVLAYLNRSASKSALKDTNGALNDCKKVIQLDNKNGQGHYYLGLHYFSLGNYEASINHFNLSEKASGLQLKWVDMSPGAPKVIEQDYRVALADIYYERAISKMANKNYFEAILDLQYCVDKDYYLEYCFCRIGECYQKMSKNEEACKYYNLSREIGFDEADSLIEQYCE